MHYKCYPIPPLHPLRPLHPIRLMHFRPHPSFLFQETQQRPRQTHGPQSFLIGFGGRSPSISQHQFKPSPRHKKKNVFKNGANPRQSYTSCSTRGLACRTLLCLNPEPCFVYRASLKWRLLDRLQNECQVEYDFQ